MRGFQTRIHAGDTIGNFTLLERVAQTGKDKHKRFLVRCNPCGTVIEKNTNDVKKQKSCGCLYFHDDRKSAIIAAFYSHLKKRHKKYDGDLIPLERFIRLSELSCRYCGVAPSNAARIQGSQDTWLYSGLDRINSQYGYIEGNVQPCCKRCNIAKGDMTESEFLEHVAKIVNHRCYP